MKNESLDSLHSCSYYCEKPACIRAQRDSFVKLIEKSLDREAAPTYSIETSETKTEDYVATKR